MTQGCLEEEGLEEGGGVGYHHEEKGGKVGCHHLTHDFALHDDCHANSSLSRGVIDENNVSDFKQSHVLGLKKGNLVGEKCHRVLVETTHIHLNRAFLI